MAISSTQDGIVVEHKIYTSPKTRERVKRFIPWESILGIVYNNDGGNTRGGSYYVFHSTDNSPILTISSKDKGNSLIREYISNIKSITGDDLLLHDISRPTGKLLQIIAANPSDLDIIRLMLIEMLDKLKFRNVYTLMGAIILFGYSVNVILSRSFFLSDLIWASLFGLGSIFLGYWWYQYDIEKAIQIYSDFNQPRI